MDIAIISDHACPISNQGSVDAGGQNIYVAQLAEKLSRNGHQVEVFTRKEHPDDPIVEFIPSGYTLIRVPAGPVQPIPKEQLIPFMKDFEFFMETYFLKKSKFPDLIHANFFMSGLVALNLKRNLRIPFFITFHALGKVRRMHQHGKDHFPDSRFEIEQNIINHSDGIIAECPQDFADLVNLYGANPSKIKIVPCGFDPDEMKKINREEARRELNLHQSEIIILHLGRLVPRKGAENIIRALALLKTELKDFKDQIRLLIVGGEQQSPDPELNPEIKRLSEVAHNLGVLENVIFTGRRDRKVLKYYYSACDIFVTTPWYEPFGITPLEAMACGIPVIGSEVGGLKFSIDNGVTGLLIPPEDPQSLKQALLALILDDELRHEMGLASEERAHSFFRWDLMVKQIEKIFYQHMFSQSLIPSMEVENVYR